MHPKLVELGKQEQEALSRINTAERNLRKTAKQMLKELSKKDPHSRSLESQRLLKALRALLKLD